MLLVYLLERVNLWLGLACPMICVFVVGGSQFKTISEYVPLNEYIWVRPVTAVYPLLMRVHVIPLVDISVRAVPDAFVPTIIAVVGLIIFMSIIV